jgi:hypothetical protein
MVFAQQPRVAPSSHPQSTTGSRKQVPDAGLILTVGGNGKGSRVTPGFQLPGESSHRMSASFIFETSIAICRDGPKPEPTAGFQSRGFLWQWTILIDQAPEIADELRVGAEVHLTSLLSFPQLWAHPALSSSSRVRLNGAHDGRREKSRASMERQQKLSPLLRDVPDNNHGSRSRVLYGA